MGTNGETHTTTVSDLAKNGELVENHTHQVIAGNNCGYWGSERTGSFEVIEIVYDINPYPMLLGIDWSTDMNGIINLKKWKMIFEKKSLSVIVPLDPAEGLRYIELVHNYESDDDLDCIYKITAWN